MYSFENVLDKGALIGHFDNVNDLETAIHYFESVIPHSSCSISDGSGKRWIDVYDSLGNLIIILHTYYKIAFILSKYTINTNDIYCVKVDNFNKAEWFIDDLNEFNKKYPFMFWDEPLDVVNYQRFSLLDMKFVTE